MNTEFKNELKGIKDPIKILADDSRKIFKEFFKSDLQLEQEAFELFAQGGYVAWHAFIRAAGLLELTDDKEHLLQTERHMVLAAAILASMIESGRRPVQIDDPSRNKLIDQKILDGLESTYLKLTFEEIDKKIAELEDESITKTYVVMDRFTICQWVPSPS